MDANRISKILVGHKQMMHGLIALLQERADQGFHDFEKHFTTIKATVAKVSIHTQAPSPIQEYRTCITSMFNLL